MKQHGLFHGNYQAKFAPTGKSLGKLCHAYSGLGGAYPGMYKDYYQNPFFRKSFDLMDNEAEALGLLPISYYVLKPQEIPAPLLHLFQMLATSASQVAIGMLLTDKFGEPDYLTGHSFGETALLIVNGVVTTENMSMLGMMRVKSYPPMFSLGGMVVASASVEALGDILQIPDVYLANTNSPRQTVLSFHNRSEKILLEALRSKRIPSIKMEQLPHPYHSPLLDDLRLQELQRITKLKIKISPPKRPFYSGTIQKWIDRENYQSIDWPDLLSRQIFNPVDFTRQIHELRQRGTDRYYEIGTGRMIELFLKGIYQREPYVYRSGPDMVASLLEDETARPDEMNLKSSAWFSKIRDTLTSVTGYKKEEITLQQKFQDDLGIDSLKKAEILLGVFSPPAEKAQDYNPYRFNTIYDVVKYLEDYSGEVDPRAISYESKIGLFVPTWKPSPGFDVASLPTGKVVDVPLTADLFTACEKRASAEDGNVIFSLTFEEPHSFSFDELARLKDDYSQWVQRVDQPPLSFCLIDLNAQGASSPFMVFLLTLARESNRLKICHMTSDERVSPAKILREFTNSPTTPIRYSQSLRYLRAFDEFVVPKATDRTPRTIVSLGGSRGIGFEILKNFPVIPGDRLVLIGRSSVARLAHELEGLRAHWKNFDYLSLDAKDAEALTTSLGHVLPDRRIDCLLNLTGQELSQSFEHKSSEEIRTEYEGKWLPFLSIGRLKENFQIAKVLHFSSIVAQFGNIGQSVYGYTNALIEREAKDPTESAIAWAPWEGIGMTSQAAIMARHKAWGLSLISPQKGALLAHQMILATTPLPRVIIPMDHKEVLLLNFQLIRNEKHGGYQNLHQAIFFHDVKEAHAPNEGHLRPSYFLAQMLGIWQELFKETPSLRHIIFGDPLKLEAGRAKYKFQIFYRRPFQFKAFTTLDHFSCEVDAGVEVETTKDRNQALTKVTSQRGSDFDVWLAIFDQVFQLLSLQVEGLRKADQRLAQIGAFSIHEKIADKSIHWVSTEASLSSSGGVVGSAALLNAQHEVVAELKQVKFE